MRAQPLNRATLIDALVDRLRADVLADRYPAGTLLPPERDLAVSYGVTRTSVRHALIRLAEAGLVETRHGVGTRVRDYRRYARVDLLPVLVAAATGPDATADGLWLSEVFEVRREVGALVVAQAARNRSPAQAERLATQLDVIAGAGEADAVQLAESEMHRLLAEASGNRVYRLLVNSLLEAYLAVRHLFVAPFVDPAAAAARLAPLVRAVRRGDARAAQRAAHHYFATTERLMLGEP
jgi:GntR family transcriptional regulator, transcriptional repressor for pyruvate dehydrogenase complex